MSENKGRNYISEELVQVLEGDMYPRPRVFTAHHLHFTSDWQSWAEQSQLGKAEGRKRFTSFCLHVVFDAWPTLAIISPIIAIITSDYSWKYKMRLGFKPTGFFVHYICSACLHICISVQLTDFDQIKWVYHSLWLWTPLKLNPVTLSLVQILNWQIYSI